MGHLTDVVMSIKKIPFQALTLHIYVPVTNTTNISQSWCVCGGGACLAVERNVVVGYRIVYRTNK